ncbi:MAG: FHA domain-containing protein, partial [Terracidiphilus sp.]
MDIEIGIIGKPNKWVLNQSRVRIGRDPQCEVSLPAWQFPGVYGQHLSLDVVLGTVRLSGVGDPGSETYLNDRLASPGSVIRSGDVIRLGAGGPELRVRLVDTPDEIPEYEQTRVLYEPTRDFSGPGSTSVSPTPTAVTGSVRRHGYSNEAPPIIPIRNEAPISASVSQRRFDPPPPTAVSDAPVRGQARDRDHDTKISSSPLAASSATEKHGGSPDLRILESRLKGMRILLALNAVILLALFVWIVQLNKQIEQNRDELREMRAQAQTALSQLTPSLDARLSVFEKRMDAMDEKMYTEDDLFLRWFESVLGILFVY